MSSEKNKGGRPTIYSQEIADKICQRVATCSFGLKKLCTMHDDWPAMDTIYEWRYKIKEFSEQYAAAKLKQADYMAEEIVEIADEGRNDYMESLSDDDKGMGWKLNGEHVQRSKLRIDTRKWLAAKLLPRTYGITKDEERPKSEIEQYVLRKI
jgi:hypothetical protein